MQSIYSHPKPTHGYELFIGDGGWSIPANETQSHQGTARRRNIQCPGQSRAEQAQYGSQRDRLIGIHQ